MPNAISDPPGAMAAHDKWTTGFQLVSFTLAMIVATSWSSFLDAYLKERLGNNTDEFRLIYAFSLTVFSVMFIVWFGNLAMKKAHGSHLKKD